MEDIDRLIEKYEETRVEIALLEKKMEKYRKKLKDEFARRELTEYKNAGFVVRKQVQTRSSMCKKNVPDEIWDQYSTSQQVEILTVRKKTLK